MEKSLIDRIKKIKEEHPDMPLALIADIVESEAKQNEPHKESSMSDGR